MTENTSESVKELGRVIAQETRSLEAQGQKNMAKAEKRRATMLERAAERALTGK